MIQNLTYTRCDDFFIPNIKLSQTEEQLLRKYGGMRRAFLEGNYSGPPMRR